MTPRSTFAWQRLALLLLVLPACVGTPLPDPPSLSADLVSLDVTPQVDTVRIVGLPGAVMPAGATLRVTDAPFPGVLVATNADGSFGRIVPGRPGDTFYVELVLAGEDRFVGAFTAPAAGRWMATGSGADGDRDGTPDAIDCAAADPTMAGQRCARTCSADSDCDPTQTCVAGVCSGAVSCMPGGETCNGLDDDCNGLVDEGDPNGGVACAPTGGRCPQGVWMCDPTLGPSCVDAPRPEICGNGIDEDCDTVADDGC